MFYSFRVKIEAGKGKKRVEKEDHSNPNNKRLRRSKKGAGFLGEELKQDASVKKTVIDGVEGSWEIIAPNKSFG
jgi:hypothetical protein